MTNTLPKTGSGSIIRISDDASTVTCFDDNESEELQDWARVLLNRSQKIRRWSTYKGEDVVILTPTDLGFDATKGVRLHELHDPQKLAAWSKNNSNGRELELCPPEFGLLLHEKMKSNLRLRRKYPRLWLAMALVCDTDHVEATLLLRSLPEGGTCLLEADYAHEDQMRSPLDTFVYWLRK